MDIVAVTVWDEEEVSILDGEKLKPVICGFVVSDDVSSVVLVGHDDVSFDESKTILSLALEEMLPAASLNQT